MPIGVIDKNHIPLLTEALDRGMKTYLEHVGKKMTEQIDQGFDSGEDALGRSWEPLKDGDGQILVDSGKLRDSIDYAVDEDKKNVHIGSDVDYIWYHEFGAPSAGLPRRPILQPAATWAEQKLIVKGMENIVGEHIDAVSF